MKFEELPNEILFELFDLLNVSEIFRGFYGLNSRFNRVLFVHYQSYHLQFQSVSEYDFNMICQQYLPQITDRIVTFQLSIDDEIRGLIDNLERFGITLDQFHRLQRLTFYHISNYEILKNLICQCQNLTNLTHLKLIDCRFPYSQNQNFELAQSIWSLPALRNLHLDGIVLNRIASENMLRSSNSIRNLHLTNNYGSLNTLFGLFKCTPHLHHIRIFNIIAFNNEILMPSPSLLLSSLDILFTGSINELEILFQNVPNLECLKIGTNGLYLNGYQWQKLIVSHLPKIKTFEFRMDFNFPDHENIQDQITTLLDTFRTRYWITDHRWFVQYSANPIGTFNMHSLFSLPYAFLDFTYWNIDLINSTYPNCDDLQLYDQVQTLRYLVQHGYRVNTPNEKLMVFRKIRHLEMDYHLLNSPILISCLPLERLISLDISLTSCNEYFQLENLLDKTVNLYSLTIRGLQRFHSNYFQTKNQSVRCLRFISTSSPSYKNHFDEFECMALSKSSIANRCEILEITVKNRKNILQLVNGMTNLQHLTFQCIDDKINIWQAQANEKLELILWLKQYLPSTYTISCVPMYFPQLRILIPKTCPMKL